MNTDKFNNLVTDLNKDTDILDLVLEETGSKPTISLNDEAEPLDLTLDTVIYISQELKSGDIKKFEFVVCEVWLKPRHVWTIVNIKKEKTEENYWILFYDNGTYYLKKGIKGPIGVHVHLKHKVIKK
jgi:hypothetical protein